MRCSRSVWQRHDRGKTKQKPLSEHIANPLLCQRHFPPARVISKAFQSSLLTQKLPRYNHRNAPSTDDSSASLTTGSSDVELARGGSFQPGPYTGFNDGGGQGPVFDDGGGPQISKFPQNHKGPPFCENRDLRFRGGMAPLAPLYTGLLPAMMKKLTNSCLRQGSGFREIGRGERVKKRVKIVVSRQECRTDRAASGS